MMYNISALDEKGEPIFQSVHQEEEDVTKKFPTFLEMLSSFNCERVTIIRSEFLNEEHLLANLREQFPGALIIPKEGLIDDE